jgi:uncharacterized glyoxalase superfamily protein PhnB
MTEIIPYLLYADCEAALDWLAEAFGLEEVLRYKGEQGYVNHAEMRLGDAVIYMGDPGDDYRNPKEVGHETVGIYCVVDDVDAHFERAKAAGAVIREEPEDKPYGIRSYTARDPEGHLWFFATPIAEVEPEEWGATRAAAAR